MKFKALKTAEENEAIKGPNNDSETNEKSYLLDNNSQDQLPISTTKTTENQTVEVSSWRKIVGVVHTFLEELTAPPTLGAVSTTNF